MPAKATTTRVAYRYLHRGPRRHRKFAKCRVQVQRWIPSTLARYAPGDWATVADTPYLPYPWLAMGVARLYVLRQHLYHALGQRLHDEDCAARRVPHALA